MRIATWNVERLKHKKQLGELIAACGLVDADILVLTETDEQIQLAYPYKVMTPSFSSTEHRVAIYSRYEIEKIYPTFDAFTALCASVNTDAGPLLVYGTIMGVLGNREKSFLPELKQQCRDFDMICQAGFTLCVCGDYNLSFSDNYYYTNDGRKAILDCFERNGIRILTADAAECIDHIAISNSFADDAKSILLGEWNKDKALSDHKGIFVDL